MSSSYPAAVTRPPPGVFARSESAVAEADVSSSYPAAVTRPPSGVFARSGNPRSRIPSLRSSTVQRRNRLSRSKDFDTVYRARPSRCCPSPRPRCCSRARPRCCTSTRRATSRCSSGARRARGRAAGAQLGGAPLPRAAPCQRPRASPRPLPPAPPASVLKSEPAVFCHVVAEQPLDPGSSSGRRLPGALVGDGFALALATLVTVVEVKAQGVGALVRVQAEGRVAIEGLTQTSPYILGAVAPLLDDPVPAAAVGQVLKCADSLGEVLRECSNLCAKFGGVEAAGLQQALLWADRRPLLPGLPDGDAGPAAPALERAQRLSWAALSPLPQASETVRRARGVRLRARHPHAPPPAAPAAGAAARPGRSQASAHHSPAPPPAPRPPPPPPRRSSGSCCARASRRWRRRARSTACSSRRRAWRARARCSRRASRSRASTSAPRSAAGGAPPQDACNARPAWAVARSRGGAGPARGGARARTWARGAAAHARGRPRARRRRSCAAPPPPLRRERSRSAGRADPPIEPIEPGAGAGSSASAWGRVRAVFRAPAPPPAPLFDGPTSSPWPPPSTCARRRPRGAGGG